MKGNIHLLVIDPQNDFCDMPVDYWPADPTGQGKRLAPALPVAGAHADMQRLAAFIRRSGKGISAISVTLDSHHRLDIAHPTVWQQADGSAVEPFTQFGAAEVRAGRYRPRDPRLLSRVLAYLDALERSGRYRFTVWPVHCEIGTFGHNVHADVRAAYGEWEAKNLVSADKILKSGNRWTEHYSALMAEVPDPTDPGTQLNQELLNRLAAADLVVVAGEAGSHCVRATLQDMTARFDAVQRSRIVLLTDCMSPVAGFEKHYAQFLGDMRAQGVQTARSDELLPDVAGKAHG